MLNLTTALGRNGLQDWLLQRITAGILATYATGLLLFWLLHIGEGPYPWQILFNLGVMRFATLLALIALMIHAWIGIWVVSTDYVKSATVRLLTLIFVYCWLLLDFIWCVQILWGD